MTTIACSLREMAADSRVTEEGVGVDVYSAIKIHVSGRALYGVCGENCIGSTIGIEWLQSGAPKDFRPVPPKGAEWTLIELSPAGIAVYNTYLEKEQTSETILAVGSGRKVALYCMRIHGMSPAAAVREACKVDHWSNTPIHVASIRDLVVKKWNGKSAKKRKA